MSKKKTHEEFLSELNNKPNAKNIVVLNNYDGAYSKLHCKCLICDYEWYPLPNNLLKLCNCPKCIGKSKKTNKEFVNELKEKNIDITPLEKYINAKTKIKVRCDKCQYEWSTTPDSVLHKKSNCPNCTTVFAKLDTNIFKERLKRLNSNIEVVGTYINNKTPIAVKCKIDGYQWDAIPANLFKTPKCPKCSNIDISYKEKFNKKMSLINPNIVILGDYVNNSTKVKCVCKKCNNEWSAEPRHLLDGHGCYKCRPTKPCKSNDIFIEELKQVNDEIIPLSEYINQDTKIKVCCTICKNIWMANPSNLLCGRGCHRCSESKGEKRIRKYLTKNYIKYEDQYKYDDLIGVGCGLLSYDFYLPDFNLLIEYQGNFHDGTVGISLQDEERLEIQQEHDRRKKEYANNNNIKLLEIWYWDFDSIEDILNNTLSTK